MGILFLLIAAKFEIRDFDMIYLRQLATDRFCYFARVLFSRDSTSTRFRENKTLAKISKFTVLGILCWQV